MPVFLSNNIYEDKKLYGITPKNKNHIKPLAVLLNSTLTRFFIEFTCRQLTGAQAIADIDVAVVEQCSVIDMEKLLDKQREKLEYGFELLSKNKSHSIFKELENREPQKIKIENIVDYRKKIDKIVMEEILGLTDEEQLEVYRAVIDLVKSRIEKAKSVGVGRKTKSGIDTEAVINIVIKQIGEKNLKNWYKEKVLNHRNLGTKRLPELGDKPKIEKTLFGWQIKDGKKTLQCRSEIEARYCKIWIEAGVKSVKIPNDEKYLAKITPELESRKVEIDEIIESYLGSILDYKLKSQILHQVCQKII